jgi:hypothetical protein
VVTEEQVVKLDGGWYKVNDAFMKNRHEEIVLLKKALDDCRAEKK